MVKRKLTLLFFLCFGLFSIGLGAGYASEKTKTQISFWHTMNAEETQTLKFVIDEFHRDNPDVAVKIQSVPFSDAQNKYKIAAGAGDAPDVFRAEIAWIADLAELGYLEELSKSFNASYQTKFLPAALRYGQYKGKLWAIPQVTDCLALLYNKKMLKDSGAVIPKTFEQMVTMGKTLSKPAENVYALGVNPEAYWAQVFIWAYGGDLIESNTRTVKIASPKSLEGMDFLADLYHKHKIISPDIDFVNGYNNMMTAFKKGKTAMIINGPWSTSDVLSGEAFKDPSNLGVAVIPKGPAGYGSPVGGNSYVIYAGSKHKEASARFVKYMAQMKYQVLFAQKHNLLPTLKAAYEDKAVKANPILQGFKTQLEVATNRPVIPEGARIYTAFNMGVQQVLTQAKSPKIAMKKVAKKWKKLLR